MHTSIDFRDFGLIDHGVQPVPNPPFARPTSPSFWSWFMNRNGRNDAQTLLRLPTIMLERLHRQRSMKTARHPTSLETRSSALRPCRTTGPKREAQRFRVRVSARPAGVSDPQRSPRYTTPADCPSTREIRGSPWPLVSVPEASGSMAARLGS